MKLLFINGSPRGEKPTSRVLPNRSWSAIAQKNQMRKLTKSICGKKPCLSSMAILPPAKMPFFW